MYYFHKFHAILRVFLRKMIENSNQQKNILKTQLYHTICTGAKRNKTLKN